MLHKANVYILTNSIVESITKGSFWTSLDKLFLARAALDRALSHNSNSAQKGDKILALANQIGSLL